MVSGKGIVLVHSTVAPWRKAMLLLSEASTVFFLLFICLFVFPFTLQKMGIKRD